MTDPTPPKIILHIRAFVDWLKAVLELFPALWQAAVVFAPLVIDYCPMCKKPRTVLWIPVNDHALCDKLDDVTDTDALYVNESTLPPL
jgi:hypothetical protein